MTNEEKRELLNSLMWLISGAVEYGKSTFDTNPGYSRVTFEKAGKLTDYFDRVKPEEPAKEGE